MSADIETHDETATTSLSERARQWVVTIICGAILGSMGLSVYHPTPRPDSFSSPATVRDDCTMWGGQRVGESEVNWRDPQVVCSLRSPKGGRAASVVFEGAEIDTSRFVIDGLTIVHGSCSEHPDAACVKVSKGDPGTFEGRDADGVTRDVQPSSRSIVLGSSRESTACHEALHALGLSHHWFGGGCLDVTRDDIVPSRDELEALSRAYGGK